MVGRGGVQTTRGGGGGVAASPGSGLMGAMQAV
jgi:hypothetical protein